MTYTEKVQVKHKTLMRRKEILKRKATRSEIILMKLLYDIHAYFQFQERFIAKEYYCICDFYLPDYKLCIEVDGGYHFTEEQRQKDKAKNNYILHTRHLGLFRISNEDAETISRDE